MPSVNSSCCSMVLCYHHFSGRNSLTPKVLIKLIGSYSPDGDPVQGNVALDPLPKYLKSTVDTILLLTK